MSFRIEAFEAPSAGAKWGLPQISGKEVSLNIALELGRNSGKYTRSVLITMDKSSHIYYNGAFVWDAVFIIRESIDATLAITYLSNIPKGALCYIASNVTDVLINKILSMSKSHAMTVLLSCTAASIIKYDVDGIFFPAVYPETKDCQEVIDILRGKMGIKIQELDIVSILKEIRASNAILQWSKWGEQHTSGSLYWNYEVAENKLEFDVIKRIILGLFTS